MRFLVRTEQVIDVPDEDMVRWEHGSEAWWYEIDRRMKEAMGGHEPDMVWLLEEGETY